jgi:hypothetical protein
MAINRVQINRSSVSRQRPPSGSHDPGELYVNWPDRQIGTIDAAKAPADLVPVRFFSATAAYQVGELVAQGDKIYRARVPTTAVAFNPANWDVVAAYGAGGGADADLLDGQHGTFYLELANHTGVINEAQHGALGGGNLHAPATTTVNGFMLAADKAKLDGVQAGATDDLTAAEILAAVKTVDGAGSGLDADLLDAQTGTWYQDRANHTGTQAISTVSGLQPALDLKAPLASPAFTGSPTAPTPPPDDNDTSIATTAYVQVEIADRLTDAPSDGLVYGRKNALWSTVIGGAHTDDNPPPPPLQDGQLWWKSDEGNLYIWYDDGTSQQWVQVNISSGEPVQQTAQIRNRIVNPAMQVSQQGGADSSVSLSYPADQWSMYWTGTGMTCTAGRFGTNSKFIRLYNNAAKASLAAGDVSLFSQYLEGNRIADFFWGTASGKQAILRFTLTCSVAGTYGVSIINIPTARSFIKPLTVAANVAKTFTIVIPPCPDGTWATDNTAGLNLSFSLAAGSTWLAPVEGWNNGNYRGLVGMSNGMAAATTSFMLTDVGLYLDPDNTGIPPKWQISDEAEELRKCQRYYQTTTGIIYCYQRYATDPYRVGHIFLKDIMRVAPAGSLTGTVGVAAGQAIALDQATPSGLSIAHAANNTTDPVRVDQWVANARM